MDSLSDFIAAYKKEIGVALIGAGVGALIAIFREAIAKGFRALVGWLAGLFSRKWAERRFEQRYRKAIIEDCRYPHIRGIRTRSPVSMELDEVYVSPSLVFAGSRWEEPADEWKDEEGDERARMRMERERPERKMTVGGALRANKRLVVLGDPGSGKSTLVRHLALEYARNASEHGLGVGEKRLPLLICLRDARPVTESGEKRPCKPIVEMLESAWAERGLHPPSGFFEKKLQHGECAVLLDGLDEVADECDRATVAEWVETTVASYPDNRYLVTSRIVGYPAAALGQGFAESKIADLSSEEIRQFAKGWCLAVEKASGGDTPGGRRKAETAAGELIAAIEKNDRVSALAVNPLLLTIIALVHRYRAQLPNRRADLYQECVDVLLGHWDTAKGIHGELDPSQKRAILAPIALRLHTDRVRDAARLDIEQMLAEGLAKAARKPQEAAEFLDNIHERSGLLEERGLRRWGFTHHTFQEYLAALALSEHEDAVEFLVARRFDPWWREVILLFAGMKDATPLVRRLLAERDDVFSSGLILAGFCVADAASVDPGMRGNTVKRLQNLVWGTDQWVIREPALEARAALQDEHLWEEIGEALRSSDSYLRWTAVFTLRIMGGDRALQLLLPLIQGEDPDMAGSAVEAVGSIGGDNGVELLATLLEADNPAVRFSAVSALSSIGGDEVFELLTPLLKDEDPDVRWGAVYALWSSGGSRAVQRVIPLLRAEDAVVRGTAASALGSIGGGDVLEFLVPLTEDEDSEVRKRVGRALGKIGGDKALNLLIPLLKDKNSDVRGTAASALGSIGGGDVLEFLVPLTEDEDSEVRWRAAEALGDIGGDKALELLVPLLKDENPFVRQSATSALRHIGGDRAFELLVHLLTDENPDVRGSAAYALGSIGGDKALELLIPMIQDQHSHARWRVARALESIGGDEAPELLVPLLRDDDSDVRSSAIETLGSIGGDKAVQLLIPLLKTEDAITRWSAMYAIQRIRLREGLVVYEDGTLERIADMAGKAG